MRSDPINPPVSTARRPRRGWLRDARRVIVLAVLLLACVATANAQADASVQIGAGPAQLLTAADIATGGTPASGPGTSQSLTGLTLDQLLARQGISSPVKGVIVNGSALPADQIAGLALVAADTAGRTYHLAATGQDYVRSSYVTIRISIQAAPTQATGGASLQVRVNATPNPVSSHAQPVNFAALLLAAPGGSSALTYSWSFGDGAPNAYGAAVQHTYPADGQYPAYVTVVDGQGDKGTGSVTVNVGHPHRTTAGSGLGTSNATGSGAGGTGTGKGGAGGGTNTGGKGATQPKPSKKAPVKPVVRPGAAAKAATAAAAAKASQPVQGILLADVGSPLDLRLSPPPPSGSPGAAHKSAGGSSGFGAVLGGLALALAIAALGGLTERRRGTLRPA